MRCGTCVARLERQAAGPLSGERIAPYGLALNTLWQEFAARRTTAGGVPAPRGGGGRGGAALCAAGEAGAAPPGLMDEEAARRGELDRQVRAKLHELTGGHIRRLAALGQRTVADLMEEGDADGLLA